MEFRMTGGDVARSRYRGVSRSWSEREWAALPPDQRPEGAIRFGLGWVLFISGDRPESGPTHGEGAAPSPCASPHRDGPTTRPVAEPAVDRSRRVLAECLIVDPSSPAVREFLHRATLDGLIRTAPAGPGRVLVLPTPLWSLGGPGPDVGTP